MTFTCDGRASPIWFYLFSIKIKQNYKTNDLKEQVENNNQVNEYLNKKEQKYDGNNF